MSLASFLYGIPPRVRVLTLWMSHSAVVASLPFTMDLHFDYPKYLDLIDGFYLAAGGSFALTNDYWSWPKELDASQKGGGRIVNAVMHFIEKTSCSADEALEKVKLLAVEYERKALEQRKLILVQNPDLPADVRRFMDGIIWVLGGASLWSAKCKRYHEF